MKYPLLISIFFLCFTFSSIYSKSQHKGTADKLVLHYNKENYDSLYTMLSASFKKEFSREAHDQFYKTSIKPYGNIQSVSYLTTQSGVHNYLVKFEKEKLKLSFLLGKNDMIESLQWLPYVEEIKHTRNTSTIQTNNPLATPLQKKIDTIVRKFFDNPVHCGLSIGVIQNGKKDTYFYGEVKKESGKLPDANTLYEVGSITKTFTGLLLAKAVIAGKIGLDDDICKYLPATYSHLKFNSKPILVKHLSNHTSGLSANPLNLTDQKDYDPNDPFKNYNTQLLYDFLKSTKPETIPGTTFEYSNTGTGLLGIIICSAYNKPFETLCRELITDPLNLKSTQIHLDKKEMETFATGYNSSNGEPTPYWNWMDDMAAIGGLKSNITDMMNYLLYQMNTTGKEIELLHQTTFTDAQQSVGLNWMLFPY
jgi:CubicO group peptidase (beta-lactamase class C family)